MTIFRRDRLGLDQIPPDPEEETVGVDGGVLGGAGGSNPRVPQRRQINGLEQTKKLRNHLLIPNILQTNSPHISSMHHLLAYLSSDRWGRG
jgi:hypothetical protein